MAISKAQREAVTRYEKENYYKITARFPIRYKERLTQAAHAADMSVNNFMVSAALEKIGETYDPDDLIARKKATKQARLEAEAKRWASMTSEEMEVEETRLENKPFEELTKATQEAIKELESGGGEVFDGTASDFLKSMIED